MDTDNSMVITRGKEGWEQVEEGEWGINGDRRNLDCGWWARKAPSRWRIAELYTWNLHNFSEQCNSNTFN